MHESASAVAPEHAAEIRILDDDPQVLKYLVCVVGSLGYKARGFQDPDELFGAVGERTPACLIVDWHLPGHDGLEIIAQCRKRWPTTPALLVSGHVTVPVTVAAMRQGAAGVLEKPIRPQDLAGELALVLSQARDRTAADAERAEAQCKLQSLSELELSILKLIVEGTPNKNIATQTGIAIRTVEKYRRIAFDKLGVNSAAEATRVWVLANVDS
jgi:FixJ family two-component response regulator